MNLNKEILKDKLDREILLADGAFGTYYAKIYDTNDVPELANEMAAYRVMNIHREYIDSGANLIRTNTFASNTILLNKDIEGVKNNIIAAVDCAKRTAREFDREIFIAGDIGPIPNESMFDREQVSQEYCEIVKTFLAEGIEVFVFETFSEIEIIKDAIELIGDNGFVIVQFSINQFGYSNAGLSARKLVEEADRLSHVDAIGFNCGIGPGHMKKLIETVINKTGKYFTAFPNAGYPQVVSGRMVFTDKNTEYFSKQLSEIAQIGARIVGGCCGTSPEYISAAMQLVNKASKPREPKEDVASEIRRPPVSNAFFKEKNGKKLIAVELAPPANTDDEKLMEAAFMLKDRGVDVLTFPDSPSGRTRADSILVAEKVARETGMCVMPHLCCRDKNAIAMRSQLLGAHINNINNFLVMTGDPIPSMVRSTVKSVFNFDSVGLMNIISDMNEEHFADSPMSFGGVINQGRRNLQIEIERVKKKMQAGAEFFLTQPIFSDRDVANLKKIKEETGARILCGIMPLVSYKNASFMKNEMTGIDVTEEIISRYSVDMNKEQGEAVGIAIAKEFMGKTDFLDGYYFSFPFNRVYMLEKIMN